MKLKLASSFLLLCSAAAWAQAPVTDAVRNNIGRFERNMNAAAEQMPADKYNYKPTEQQITYAHLVAHIAQSNDLLCSALGGGEKPKSSEVKDTDGKDKLVAALKESFTFCQATLSKMDDSKLAEEVEFFGGRKVSRATALIALSNDWADHYGTQAMYLRLNGMLPPTAQPKK